MNHLEGAPAMMDASSSTAEFVELEKCLSEPKYTAAFLRYFLHVNVDLENGQAAMLVSVGWW